jgi:hypothetical protein
MRRIHLALLIISAVMVIAGGAMAQKPPPPGGDKPPPPNGDKPPPNNGGSSVEIDASVIQVTLDISEYKTFGNALTDQITAGDGRGVDNFFRNSGVVIDEESNAYYAVNGVHPVNQGDYTSYYPKSLVKASLEDDTILETYSFTSVNGHDVDMEALTFTDSLDTLYIGDEYNLIYELDLATGEVTREWDLADIGVSTNIDKGIEAMTYSPETGYFYAGIQDLVTVVVVDLGLSGEGETVTKIDDFPVAGSPSGLFAHSDGTLYVSSMSGGGGSGGQMIYRYQTDGTLLCAITIPSELGMTRPDGIAFDSTDEYVYLVDSQGPIYDGSSLYKIAWTNPCQ